MNQFELKSKFKAFVIISSSLDEKERFNALVELFRVGDYIEVINDLGWRNGNCVDCTFQLMGSDALFVVGDFIGDKDCEHTIAIANTFNKPIVQWESSAVQYANIFSKTVPLQRLISEHFVYCPKEESVNGAAIAKTISLEMIRGKCKDSELVSARAIFCYVCTEILKLKIQEISWLINRERTSVMYLLTQYKNWYSTDRDFKMIADSIILGMNKFGQGFTRF